MTLRLPTLRGRRPAARIWTVAVTVATATAPALPAQLQYFGPELRVNSTTAGSQFGPAVAIGPSGESVVAWQSGDQDGSGFGVFAQRYDSGGAAVGGEFRLSTTTAGHQVTPALAIDPAGVVFAVWASENKDGSNYAVVLRRFATDGTALGGEVVVNTSTAGSQLAPRVATSAAGAVVVWSGPNVNDATQTEVYARRLSPTGAFAGGELRVNGTTFGNQLQPAVAMDASGRFVVAWESSDAQDGSGYGVYARRYDAAGNAQGGEFLVNSVTTIYDQSAPAVAFDASGAFVVVWQSSLQAGPSPIGPQPTIYGQRYDSGARRSAARSRSTRPRTSARSCRRSPPMPPAVSPSSGSARLRRAARRRSSAGGTPRAASPRPASSRSTRRPPTIRPGRRSPAAATGATSPPGRASRRTAAPTASTRSASACRPSPARPATPPSASPATGSRCASPGAPRSAPAARARRWR